MKKTFVHLMLLLALGSCQREQDDTPYTVSGRLFVFNYRVAEASYMVTLARNGPVKEGTRVRAAFDDPAGGAPIVIERPGWPLLDKVVLASPPIRCVKAGVAYGVSITVSHPQDGVLQELATEVVSTLDQSVLPAKPLVVGPAYTPNPEVFKRGGPDLSPDPDCAS